MTSPGKVGKCQHDKVVGGFNSINLCLADTQLRCNNVTVNAVINENHLDYGKKRQEHNESESWGRGRGFLLSPGGNHGNRGTVYLEAVALTPIALPHAGAQPPLPIAIRVPTRMPTADSFVGMPFMRPTLRMHCPSTLQRHTITEDRQGRKVRAVGEGSPASQRLKPSPAG